MIQQTTPNTASLLLKTEHQITLSQTTYSYVLFFKIQPTSQLKKLMDAYCQHESLNKQNVKFLFKGQVIHETQTPQQLSMQNGDLIEVKEEQEGCINIRAESQVSLYLKKYKQVFFKIKLTTCLRKLIDAYCLRQNLNKENVMFFYKDVPIVQTQTPQQLNMKNGDQIHVVVKQA